MVNGQAFLSIIYILALCLYNNSNMDMASNDRLAYSGALF